MIAFCSLALFPSPPFFAYLSAPPAPGMSLICPIGMIQRLGAVLSLLLGAPRLFLLERRSWFPRAHGLRLVTSAPFPLSLDCLLCFPLPIIVSDASLGYRKITIPPTSELIFADAYMELHVRNVLVEGKLRMGSETCKLYSKILIHFDVRLASPCSFPFPSPLFSLLFLLMRRVAWETQMRFSLKWVRKVSAVLLAVPSRSMASSSSPPGPVSPRQRKLVRMSSFCNGL